MEIPDLLNDFGVILAIDCDRAHQWFSESNEQIPSTYSLKFIIYNTNF